VERVLGLWDDRAIGPLRRVDRFEREQGAQVGIDLEVRDGRGRELPRRCDARLALGTLGLVLRATALDERSPPAAKAIARKTAVPTRSPRSRRFVRR
jgi:hypothetical protein